MNLVTYNPFEQWCELNSVMDHWLNDSFTELKTPSDNVWTPVTDVTEFKNELVFTTELPGFQKNDVDIAIHNGHLTITAERKCEDDKDTKKHCIERWYGKFYRSFLMPESADPGKISAKLEDGVLTIKVQKKEEAKPRQIDISVS